jgi:hypothetical protein
MRLIASIICIFLALVAAGCSYPQALKKPGIPLDFRGSYLDFSSLLTNKSHEGSVDLIEPESYLFIDEYRLDGRINGKQYSKSISVVERQAGDRFLVDLGDGMESLIIFGDKKEIHSVDINIPEPVLLQMGGEVIKEPWSGQ